VRVDELHTIEADLQWLQFVPDVDTAVSMLAEALT
jgi:hypothetical protein